MVRLLNCFLGLSIYVVSFFFFLVKINEYWVCFPWFLLCVAVFLLLFILNIDFDKQKIASWFVIAEAKKQVLLVKGCLDACISHIILWDCAYCDWMLPGTSNINLMVEYSIELDIFHVESCFSQFDTFVFNPYFFWLLFYKNLKLCEILWSCIIWSVCWWCGVEDFLTSRFLCTSHTQQYRNNQPYPIPGW